MPEQPGSSGDGHGQNPCAPGDGEERFDRAYPRLYRIAWSADEGEVSSGSAEPDEFMFGIDRILDGVQALIEQANAS